MPCLQRSRLRTTSGLARSSARMQCHQQQRLDTAGILLAAWLEAVLLHHLKGTLPCSAEHPGCLSQLAGPPPAVQVGTDTKSQLRQLRALPCRQAGGLAAAGPPLQCKSAQISRHS